jgi:SulP family sulfate permease
MKLSMNAFRANLLRIVFPFLFWEIKQSKSTFKADIIAGITGAVIVLPQGVAYAMIAGLPPEYGIYTAIVPAIIAALYGSSHHSITGPTAATSIIVLMIVGSIVPPDDPAFISYVLTLTFLAGVFQLALGTFRLGVLINFISHSVVIGFTAGAAVLIATSQFKHFFGLPLPSSGEFIGTMIGLAKGLPQSNLATIGVATFTIIVTLIIKKVRPYYPGMLISMVLAGVLCYVLNIGEASGVHMVGSLPGHLPPLSMPNFHSGYMPALMSGAISVGILSLVQAISTARAVAVRSQQTLDNNQEFIGQGLANIVGSFFSCYASSGSFTRSGANYDAGARTPVAAMLSALFLVVILLLIPGATAFLPIPAMAGVILVIAWNLIDLKSIKVIIKTSKRETFVLIATFVATLLVSLDQAIYLGALLALILYLKQTSCPNIVHLIPEKKAGKYDIKEVEDWKIYQSSNLVVLRLDGSLYFGSVDHVHNFIQEIIKKDFKNILIVCNGINFIDVAGAEMLLKESRLLAHQDIGLYFSELKYRALRPLIKGGYFEEIGSDKFFATTQEALEKIANF